MTYRPRRLKKAKTPMSPAAWRYFMAPVNTSDDYHECAEEARTGSRRDFFGLYYANDWKELWRNHKVAIEAEWLRRFPDPEVRASHRRWAVQSYHGRMHDMFMARRDDPAENDDLLDETSEYDKAQKGEHIENDGLFKTRTP
jgi:hypothetical protein